MFFVVEYPWNNPWVFKELDRDRLIHTKEKRKLTQRLMPSSTPSICNYIDNDDEQELFSSSSTMAKRIRIRDNNDDQVSDIEIIHDHTDSINEDNE